MGLIPPKKWTPSLADECLPHRERGSPRLGEPHTRRGHDPPLRIYICDKSQICAPPSLSHKNKLYIYIWFWPTLHTWLTWPISLICKGKIPYHMNRMNTHYHISRMSAPYHTSRMKTPYHPSGLTLLITQVGLTHLNTKVGLTHLITPVGLTHLITQVG
jgi:hypothetical protein